MFITVTSRADLARAVTQAARGLGRVWHASGVQELQDHSRGNLSCWKGLIIDFRDYPRERFRLVDQPSWLSGAVLVVAVVEESQGELLFDLARRGVRTWLPGVPDGAFLRETLEGLLREGQERPGGAFLARKFANDNARKQPRHEPSCHEEDGVLHALGGVSAAGRALQDAVRGASASGLPVVLTGESGAGKQVVAQAIHALSPRRDKPFVDVNICGVPEGLFESEFFGTVPGAYTGAVRRKGYFHSARGGTLFLDEIGDLPGTLQPKLLKAIEQGSVYSVGSDESRRVETRLICATNRNIENMVRTGRFREDLWYRIASIIIEIPPLRDRLEDIPLLASKILQALGKAEVILAPDALAALQHRRWPGNVRELKSVLERSVLIPDAPGRVREILRSRDLVFSPKITSRVWTEAAEGDYTGDLYEYERRGDHL
ncbi:sigma 54-interacting transcriptional regulator [Alkalispirochaeta americana]|nr:sigma 54-interacting transcriptional regulator [Alkalispirochaeta americana]